jgi:hypothetical protein
MKYVLLVMHNTACQYNKFIWFGNENLWFWNVEIFLSKDVNTQE